MNTVLGLGGSGHDWSSCALRGDRIVAIDEERLTRRKYGVGSDLLAGVSRRAVLDAVGAQSPEYVIACDLVPRSFTHAYRNQVRRIDHHLAHAYSTFAASAFPEAAVLVCDNAGSLLTGSLTGDGPRVAETISCFRGNAEGIRLLDRISGAHYVAAGSESDFFQPGLTDNSLGQFYRSASLSIGLAYHGGGAHPVSEDGKTMGLAPYGDERFVDDVAELITLESEGRLSISAEKTEQTFTRLLGSGDFDARAALARAAQAVLEEALLHCARNVYERTGLKYLCIAGGVGLNSVANGRILRETPFEKIFVVPAAGDNGISLGCAYYGAHELQGQPMADLPALHDAYLGPEYPARRLELAVSKAGLVAEPVDDLPERVAELLSDGALIAWYDGRSEFGPRALGHRSILTAPFPASVRDRLNDQVKFREWFRPFAPVVLAERAGDYFDVDQDSPFMLLVSEVRKPDEIPGVTHVDGTARLQTLERSANPRLYTVIETFAARTGCPVLLNTSFNVAGQPIVESPEEAVTAFVDMRLDYLVIGEQLIKHP
ncbi:carbamoyl transferase [Streptomyces canus]|uniref:carbamoyltransferase family protein n=1 Tax=Streptomyces canus TaxID=58343 RepID=UPI0030E4A7EB